MSAPSCGAMEAVDHVAHERGSILVISLPGL